MKTHPTNAQGRLPDSYSHHEVTECDEDTRKVSRASWTVIAEWLEDPADEDSDIEETDNVADFKTEAAAEKYAAKMNQALGK